MSYIIECLFLCLLIAIPVLFFYLIIRISLIRKIKFELKKDLLRIFFVIYITSIVLFVWVIDVSNLDFIRYNFIPLKTIIGYFHSELKLIALENLIGNLIITIPLGFFAYFKIWYPKMNIFVFSLLVPLIIELGQFILFLVGYGGRSVDIDDIILNAIGILLGYYLTRFLFLKSEIYKNA